MPHTVYKGLQLDRNSEQFVAYKTLRNSLNKKQRDLKKSYIAEHLRKFKNDSRRLWSIILYSISKQNNKTNINDEMIMNGVLESNKKVISNAFAKHYSSVGEFFAHAIEQKTNNKHIDAVSYLRDKGHNNHTFYTHDCDAIEVRTLVENLISKTSCSHDGISKLLKFIIDSIGDALVILFNKSFEESVYPDFMKLALVQPLYKSKSKAVIVNCRLVSLLPAISKILEKLVHKRMVKFLRKHQILYDGQYGFRESRSCNDAILDFIGNVTEQLENGNMVISIFLDMSKAFDSIEHDALL